MFCPHCGNSIPDNAQFCPECGVALTTAGATTPAVSTPATLAEAADAPIVPTVAPAVPSGAPSLAMAAPPAAQPLPAPQASQPLSAPPAPQPLPAPQTSQPLPVTLASQPLPAPAKKSKKPLVITLVAVLVLALIGAGFGIYQLVKYNTYNNAVSSYQQAETSLSTAVSLDNFYAAQSQFQSAEVVFKDLGSYQDAASYYQLCLDQIAVCQQNIDYLNASQTMANGDYQNALTAFTALGNFKDSAAQAELCQQNLDFLEAQADYDAGNYDQAAQTFSILAAKSFPGAADWLNKTRYAQADQLFQSGKLYNAWVMFSALGDYQDAASRAELCTVPFPATGELYHDPAYVIDYYSAATINIDATASSYPTYIHIYNGDTLVCSVFVNAGGYTSVDIPGGDYSIHTSSGEIWFGEDIMFGDVGSYQEMLFDGATTVHVDGGYIYTMVHDSSSDGGPSLSNSPIDASNF